MRALLIATLALPFSAEAANVFVAHVPEQRLILVARGDAESIDAYDDRSASRLWTVPGVATPRVGAASPDGAQFAIADPIENQVAVVSIADRAAKIFGVAETPIAMRFVNDALFVISRDGKALTRIRDQQSQQVSTIDNPTHLAVSRDRLLVYSSLTGVLAEYDTRMLERTREIAVPAYAADLEADARRAYLVYPRAGEMAAVRLDQFRLEEEFTVGAVPVDLQLSGDPNLISAGTMAVADPSSKWIWNIERSQSQAEAFGRGFLRGLVGLGLYTPRSAEFPTGVDRVWAVGRRRFAWDSSSGTLYQIVRGKGRPVATATSDRDLTVVGNRVAIWSSERQTVEFRPLPE